MAKTSAVRRVRKTINSPIVAANDEIFFHKDQVTIGIVLTYYGRLAPGSKWRVNSIHTYAFDRKRKRYTRKPVGSVEHLSDDIQLVHDATGESHQVSFQYASYSAIWRLR